jgi:ABC-2 type transport system permease protein
MIRAMVQKDIKLFFRNQFFAFITAFALVIYIALYFLLPSTVDESLPFAVYIEGPMGAMVDGISGDGLELTTFDTEEALIEAVESGDYPAGLALSPAVLSAVMRGEPTTLNIYYAPGTEPELRDAINTVLESRINTLTASRAGVNMVTEIIGPQTDSPIPMRDLMLPMLLMLIFAIEIMGLATLIVEEIEHGTARAVLTTPLGTREFFTSKAIMGIGLAFVQVFVIVAVTGAIATSPALIVVALLVGCLLITGIGFLIASVARDMMGVMAWGMLALVILSLPSVTIMFPMIGAGWMEYIPSYYLVDTLHRVLNFGASWADVATNLLILLVIGAAALVAGSAMLRRRLA